MLKIIQYKHFQFQEWLIEDELSENYEFIDKTSNVKIGHNELVKMFTDGTLSQEIIDDFIESIQTNLECGTLPLIVISATDPNINTRGDAINYVITNTIDKFDKAKYWEYATYDDFIREWGFVNGNPEMEVDIGILGKYWITIISVSC